MGFWDGIWLWDTVMRYGYANEWDGEGRLLPFMFNSIGVVVVDEGRIVALAALENHGGSLMGTPWNVSHANLRKPRGSVNNI